MNELGEFQNDSTPFYVHILMGRTKKNCLFYILQSTSASIMLQKTYLIIQVFIYEYDLGGFNN